MVDEKFRKKLLISSRVIAVMLILSIVWIGYVQMEYAKDINSIKEKYGSLGYCYLCGLETFRKCECQYLDNPFDKSVNKTKVSLETANYNIQKCEVKEVMEDRVIQDFNETYFIPK